MARPRRRYPPEFREQAVEFYISVADFRSLADVASELGVHRNTLSAWVRQTIKGDKGAPHIGRGERAELLRLRKENKILKEELEISKKAAAFFARERPRP
jgi:transposase